MSKEVWYRFWLIIILVGFVTALAISYSSKEAVTLKKEYIDSGMVIFQGRIYKIRGIK